MRTPCFSYDLSLLDDTLNALEQQTSTTNFHVHYAIKANYNKAILKKIAAFGLGADCVSGQEIEWAILAGFPTNKIVFAGVGKTDEEIHYAIDNDVNIIHCEGLEEIKAVNDIASKLNKKIDVALRLNPDIDASTHSKITTGLKENKFGFSVIELNRLIIQKDELSNLNLKGLHFHIGSQITDMEVFKSLAQKINEYIEFYELNIGTLSYLNVGGGLGIDYRNPKLNAIPNFKDYFSVFKSLINRRDVPIHFELGRSIVGQCGVLLTKVLYVKESETKRFAIVDAGMTELIRPALYNAYHQIDFQGIAFKNMLKTYDVVGPICESSDYLGKDVALPNLKRGDTLVVKSCGAYAESMRLNYNGRKKVNVIYN